MGGIRSRYHHYYPRMVLCLLDINTNNAGMRIKTTHKTDVEHAWTTNIAHILPPASEQHRIFTTPNLLLRCIWLLRTNACYCCFAHVVLPFCYSNIPET